LRLITRRELLALSSLGIAASCKPAERAAAHEEVHVVKDPPRTKLIFGGDVMLSRYVGRLARFKNDPAWPFRNIAPTFAQADIAFVNLESPFCSSRPADYGMIFRAQAPMVEGLKLAGIDVVSTANNHARDCGEAGITQTLDLLAANGIAAAGTAMSEKALREGVILEKNGIKFGFLAYTYDQRNGNHRDDDARIAGMNVERMQQDVLSLRGRCDVVVVSMHAGYEYQTKPNAQQRTFARSAIDSGATLVIGHHPHVVQPSEVYRNGTIFYSLGNLIFDQEPPATHRGLVVNAVFSGAKLESLETLTVRIENTVPNL
jgi:poly-gamma-glutamate capsule biosynthesis protein CapA/YwtB (metallophosphatase superfamily)